MNGNNFLSLYVPFIVFDANKNPYSEDVREGEKKIEESIRT